MQIEYETVSASAKRGVYRSSLYALPHFITAEKSLTISSYEVIV